MGPTATYDRPVTIRLIVADDSMLVREGIVRVLATEDDLEVVASCTDYDELMAAVDRDEPDVVVTDIRMPPTGSDEGIRAAGELRQSHPDVGVVVLSQYVEPAYAVSLLDAGSEARAYLLKERVSDPGELIDAVRTVAAGGSVIDPKVVEALVTARARPKESPLRFLTPRESEVLAEIAQRQEQRGRRRQPGPVGTGGREAHQLVVLEAAPHRGARRPPAGQGGAAVPVQPPRHRHGGELGES